MDTSDSFANPLMVGNKGKKGVEEVYARISAPLSPVRSLALNWFP